MLTRLNPFEELSTLHREMDRLFGRAFADTPTGTGTQASFVPAVEVATQKDGWAVRLAIPGVDPNDVQIEVAGNTLTVRGERRREEKNEPYRTEFSYGRFERTLTLPESIDGEKVTANYRNGMLDLRLPLHESVKPRKIQIAVDKEKNEKQLAGIA
jgi:HSP20 family protein